MVQATDADRDLEPNSKTTPKAINDLESIQFSGVTREWFDGAAENVAERDNNPDATRLAERRSTVLKPMSLAEIRAAFDVIDYVRSGDYLDMSSQWDALERVERRLIEQYRGVRLMSRRVRESERSDDPMNRSVDDYEGDEHLTADRGRGIETDGGAIPNNRNVFFPGHTGDAIAHGRKYPLEYAIAVPPSAASDAGPVSAPETPDVESEPADGPNVPPAIRRFARYRCEGVDRIVPRDLGSSAAFMIEADETTARFVPDGYRLGLINLEKRRFWIRPTR